MRNPITAIRKRRKREWWARWERDHRWTELAEYNARVSKGIVHTPEYVERMRREQAIYDRGERDEAIRRFLGRTR